MTTHEERFQTDWREIYKTTPVESMPWYRVELDQDLAEELKKRKITGGKFLDIGTGPATQALKLEEMGFDVTATDLSGAAIERAKKLSKKIHFIEDDILNTKITGIFDYALDRGCFHVLHPDKRPLYVKNLHRFLRAGGVLFLKTFSVLEKDDGYGPYRFNPKMIAAAFDGFFRLESSKESEFDGGQGNARKALFSVLVRI